MTVRRGVRGDCGAFQLAAKNGNATVDNLLVSKFDPKARDEEALVLAAENGRMEEGEAIARAFRSSIQWNWAHNILG